MHDTRRAATRVAHAAQPAAALEAGLFRAHFEHLPAPAYLWERSGDDFRLIAHNRAAGEVPLNRIKELLGIKARELFANQPQVLADIYECARTGVTVSREIDFLYTTGLRRRVEMTCIALTPDIVVEHTLDITERFEADRALRDSEQRYRTIVDNAHEGIWVTDRESVTTFVNRRAAEILGYAANEMVGKSVYDFMAPEVVADAKALRQRRRDGVKEQFDFGLLHRDGSSIWVSVASAPILDIEGQFVGEISMLSDITQRRDDEMALRASEAKVRLLLDAVPDMVIHVDRTGRHLDVYVSETGRAALPYAIEDMIGKTCKQLFGEEFGNEHQRHVLAALESGAPQLWEYEFEFRDSLRHMEARFTRTSDDEVLVICRDNTERVNLQREVIAIGERERNRIGRDLHDGLAQLLTGVKLLLRSLSDRLGEEGSAYVEEARRASELVQHAIGHTSELARGLSPIPKGAQLSDGLIQLAEHSKRFFGIKCRYVGGRKLPALREEASAHLYRIAQEAVTNAVRHGRAGSIEVSCQVVKRRITLTIADDGVGVPDLQALPDGMGLSIMRYRASSLGGKLAIARGADGGTVVTCSCPLSSLRA